MKKVITYGTYDFLHYGHINLLKNAKALGDYLIVGITSEEFDLYRGKIDVRQPLVERIQAVKDTGIADEIIVEEYEGQKIADIIKYDVDIFTVGSDWVGKFDYLNEFCEVIYLPRTEGVSSTQIRRESNDILRMGMIGNRNPMERFMGECNNVNGVEVTGIYSDDKALSEEIAERNDSKAFDSVEDLYDSCNAVYIVDRIDRRRDLIIDALEHRKHVMCEGPLFLRVRDAEECIDLAKKNELVLFNAIKTKYFPGYKHLQLLIKSGKVGEVKDIDVAFSQRPEGINRDEIGRYDGSLYDMAGFIFLPIFQILGSDFEMTELYSNFNTEGADLFTRGVLKFENAVASFKTGLGVKTEGQMIITGTEGYVYVPAPWWKTDYFEVRYEDLRDTKKYFWQYQGEGFKYEVIDFARRITSGNSKDGHANSIAIARVLEQFERGDVKTI